MRSFVFVLLITFTSVLCKESLQELEDYFKDPDFIALVKRLGLDDGDNPQSLADNSAIPTSASVQPYHSSDGSCSRKFNSSTIIQTKISLSKGATFLSSEHDVSDAEHCARKCCDTDGCDVSVYQDKDKRACYLFKCKDDETNANLCKFLPHSGYYAIFVTKSVERVPSRNSAPVETDLSDLKSSGTKKPPISTAKPTTVSYHPHSVGNGGVCIEDLNCEDIHAVCRAGACRCQTGFLEKHGQCRKQCGQQEFRCQEPGTAVAGPDCIPRSQFCDGEAQCGDGSDEINCPTTGQTGSAGTAQGSSQESSEGVRPGKPGAVGGGSGGTPAKPADPDTAAQPARPKEDLAPPEAGVDGKESGAGMTDDSNGATSDAAEGKVDSDNADTDKDSEPAGGQPAVPDSSSDDSNDSKEDSKDGEEKAGPAATGTKKPDTEAPKSSAAPAEVVPGVQQESAEFVERMSLIEAYTTKGPIIALSLGLCFTVILLIFVGCRLRNVRRRLRKGRPLHSNEADYLINGMYL